MNISTNELLTESFSLDRCVNNRSLSTMADLEEKTDNIFYESEGYFYTGEPVLRTFFLVESNVWPFILCSIYVLFVKVLGPTFMRDRKPMKLRKVMIVYNFTVVTLYAGGLLLGFYGMAKDGFSILCKNFELRDDNYTYVLLRLAWFAYLGKYIEWLDTFFFVLRKKNNLITSLHVIHHAFVPLFVWTLLRTERSGFQACFGILNSLVHIVMYTYYGLAAMGPRFRKYLWWKRYLTIVQMVQFILIICIVTIVMPLSGCTYNKANSYILLVLAAFFFVLFGNYYINAFKPEAMKLKNVKNNDTLDSHYDKEDISTNEQTKFKSN